MTKCMTNLFLCNLLILGGISFQDFLCMSLQRTVKSIINLQKNFLLKVLDAVLNPLFVIHTLTLKYSLINAGTS